MCQPEIDGRPVYDEGPVWSIQFVRTKAGMTRRYFASLKEEWQTLMEEAKRHGTIRSYRVFLAPPVNREDWDVMLAIEVENMAALDRFGEKMAEVEARVRGKGTKRTKDTTKPVDTREILGMKLLREVTLK